eukprot:403366965
MDSAQSDFLILYATQTNTAKYAAEELGREAMRRQLKPKIQSFGDYNIFNMPTEKLVVFIVATTGDGDPCTMMINSWRFLLRADLPSNSLQKLNFTVFGLGDSSYEKFNAMAKKLTQRLLDLGAHLFHPVGLGDYQHDFNYEGEYDPWLNSLWQSMNKVLVGKFVQSDISESQEQNKILLPSIYKVEITDQVKEDEISHTLSEIPPPNGAVNKEVYLSKVLINERITAEDHFQNTRHIVLQISEFMTYEPGDIVMIQPQTNADVVKDFISRYNLKPQQILKITVDKDQLGQVSQSSIIKFPDEGISVQELLSQWLCLMEPPSRYFCEVISHFVEDQQRSQKLRELASKTSDGKSEYYRYCVREKRTIPEVLLDFKITDQLPLSYLIQLAGRQKPREFSISSSIKSHPNEIHLTMAVTDYVTPFKRVKHGVCSNWLASQEIQDKSEIIPIWLAKGTMKLPPKREGSNPYPIIMVGPGTGVAAFRSFIQHFQDDQTQQLILVFGSRTIDKDNYYKDEWKRYANLKVLYAHSRNEDSGKYYVQHKIRDEGEYLSKLIIEEGAFIYVSGRAKNMPKSVEKAFVDIIQKQYHDKDALQYVLTMRKNGHYQQEVW